VSLRIIQELLGHQNCRVATSNAFPSVSRERFAAEITQLHSAIPRIEPTWEQFRAGRDAVVEWILAQPLR
jgi:hypothetical protein